MGTFKGPVITTISTSGNTAQVNASGQLAVEAAVSLGAVTTSISGETVYLVSGENTVQLTSGYNIVKISGEVVKISGSVVVTSVSGNAVSVSGQTMRLISGHNDVTIWAFDPSGARYNQLWVSDSGQHSLKVDAVVDVGAVTSSVSGETVYLVSGQNTVQLTSGYNIVKISGETIVGKISGETIHLVSGFNTVQLTSGYNLVREAEPVNVFTAITLLIPGASGGVPLTAGTCSKVTVRNIGQSGTVMFVGHSGNPPWVSSGQTYPMYSGFGFWLRDGDAVTMPVQDRNTNRIRVVSHTSGERICYMGVAY